MQEKVFLFCYICGAPVRIVHRQVIYTCSHRGALKGEIITQEEVITQTQEGRI